jgi:hypothetical protein
MEGSLNPEHRSSNPASHAGDGASSDDREPDPRIEDYLDHVLAPLVGLVDYPSRQELRAELADHIASLTASYRQLGSDSEAAVVAALRKFGAPRRVALRWRRSLLGRSSHDMWRSTEIALALFGGASLLTVWWAPPGALISVDAGAAPGIEFPSFALLVPLVAGLLSGLMGCGRAALASFYAISLTIPLTLGIARAIIPEYPYYSVTLTLYQFLFWLPLGCTAAAFGDWEKRRSRAMPSYRFPSVTEAVG